MHWFAIVRWGWLVTLILLFVAIIGWKQTHHASVASGKTKIKQHRTTKEYLKKARRIVNSIPSEDVHLPADGIFHHHHQQQDTAQARADAEAMKAIGNKLKNALQTDGKPRIPTHEEAHGGGILFQPGGAGGGGKIATHEEAHGLDGGIPKVDHEAVKQAIAAQNQEYDEIPGEFKLDEKAEKYPTIADWSGKNKGLYKGIKWTLLNNDRPRVILAEDVITDEDCKSIIEAANKSLARSEVVHKPGTSGVNSVRTSYGMFLNWDDQKMAANMKIRDVVSKLMGVSPVNIEATQVLRYMPGQFYKPHPDYFMAGSEHLQRGGQRFATLLFWLNEVEGGGETRFPSAKGGAVALKPKKNSGVMFYSMTKDGQVDSSSYHEGVPPTSGEKWVAVSWVRQHEFH